MIAFMSVLHQLTDSKKLSRIENVYEYKNLSYGGAWCSG